MNISAHFPVSAQLIGAARCARCQERRLRRSTSTRRCNLIRLFAIAAAPASIRQRSLPTRWANDVAPAAARAAFGCRVGRTGRLLDSSGELRSDSPCTRLPREHPPMSCWQRRRVGQSDQNDGGSDAARQRSPRNASPVRKTFISFASSMTVASVSDQAAFSSAGACALKES